MVQISPARLVFGLALLVHVAAPIRESHGGNADPVVIEFGDQLITRAEVDERFQIAIRLLAHRQGISLAGQDPSVIASLRDQYLEKHASELVLVREAERRQLAVSDAEVDRALAELFAGDDGEHDLLEDTLLRRIVRDEQMIGLLSEEMLKEIQIPPGDVITMHHDVKDSLATAEEVCVRHIQLETVDAANGIIAELEQGANFAELASLRSIDEASAGKGGDLGCFERSHSVARSEFEKAAFAAKVGQLVGPIATHLGHHVLVVYEHKMPRAPTLNEAYAQIERELALEQLPERLQALVSESGISVHADNFAVSSE